MTHRIATVLACALFATLGAGCSSSAVPLGPGTPSPTTTTATRTTGSGAPATASTATSSSAPPSATPTSAPSTTKPNVPLPDIESSSFGQSARFTQGKVPFTVTVGKPVPATCMQSGIGCGEPKIGARFVTVPVSFLNRGKVAMEIWADDYLLVFPDGTRTTIYDGRAPAYTPAGSTRRDAEHEPDLRGSERQLRHRHAHGWCERRRLAPLEITCARADGIDPIAGWAAASVS